MRFALVTAVAAAALLGGTASPANADPDHVTLYSGTETVDVPVQPYRCVTLDKPVRTHHARNSTDYPAGLYTGPDCTGPSRFIDPHSAEFLDGAWVGSVIVGWG
ncbi:hypothetical protein LZG04_15975 [Saccharothrix sp. S26]|uniref:hypothetical protein n=1 Tax=Saccharothrix sp. S26 TaxID=2907215 RepID=UPI001F333957|nr:hypothetical protein [Saccharothrix sp. S26]MCE6996283.1 hypothetical protein [Saccharothrix sp. S26]